MHLFQGFPSRAQFSDLYAMYAKFLPPDLARLDPRNTQVINNEIYNISMIYISVLLFIYSYIYIFLYL